MSRAALTAPTWFVDSDSDEVAGFVEDVLTRAGVDREDERAVAVALFRAVRDRVRYDPYAVSSDPEDFRASTVVRSTASWCVPKAVLYTATLRHVGIPARLAFADVRNHLTSEKLAAAMGSDVFAWHGYTEVWLDGRCLKVSTAFNIELCERFGVRVLDFDGTADALFHPFDLAGNRHMEYVRERGSYDDLPLDEMLAGFAEFYTAEPPASWRKPSPAADTASDAHPDSAFAPDGPTE